MAAIYCPICGSVEWIEELKDNIVDSHADCLEEYLKIEIERKGKMNKKEAIEREIEYDTIYKCEVVFDGCKTIS